MEYGLVIGVLSLAIAGVAANAGDSAQNAFNKLKSSIGGVVVTVEDDEGALGKQE
ncbi:conserved domain protein [Roseibium sp. TrichSKD4]|uniref:hypothetical protein n=1 Tax=Roseibium sp. TrichSKD4 TaxID=744980 RepID=UPI0001E56573|nr:hypothetical protein [Roseibium sp. TrichSKD4]EFO33507.1 conserved domain protein [Roseibium sp. TrichSKD4]